MASKPQLSQIVPLKMLGVTLMNRGYEMRLLKREFCRVIDKYRTEFQKWDIPLDSKKFFTDIFA